MYQGLGGFYAQTATHQQAQILDNIFHIARQKKQQGMDLFEIRRYCQSAAESFHLPRAMYEHELALFLSEFQDSESRVIY